MATLETLPDEILALIFENVTQHRLDARAFASLESASETVLRPCTLALHGRQAICEVVAEVAEHARHSHEIEL